jgi:hypothetical protein
MSFDLDHEKRATFWDKVREGWANYLRGASGRFEGYRTYFVHGCFLLLGLLDVVDPYALASIIPFQYQGYIFVGYSILGFLLRKITHTEAPSLVPKRFRKDKGTAIMDGEG